LKVGSIVQVRSFSEYTVKVPLGENDGYVPVSLVPAGTYVSVVSKPGLVVGIVTGVRHDIKEEYLPYLTDEKQEVFVPYVNDFRSSYLDIVGVGNAQDGTVSQALSFAPAVNDVVELMDRDAIRAFHMPGGRPGFSYYKAVSPRMDPAIMCLAIDRVSESLPECRQMLAVLKKYTESKA
jgi:hypothetical protein